MKPARLFGIFTGVLFTLLLALTYTQRSYVRFLIPEPAFAAARGASFWGSYATFSGTMKATQFIDNSNPAYYIDPASDPSLVVAGSITAPTFSGNLTGSATTLQTARTIWGQTFNGSANVSGALSGATTGSFSSTVTAPTFSGALSGNANSATVAYRSTVDTAPVAVMNSDGTYFGHIARIGTQYWTLGYGGGAETATTGVLTWGANGNVGIGTTAPGQKLDVNGQSIFGLSTYTYLYLRDDESTTGPKSIHANSNLIGLLSGAGGWLSRWDNAGNQTNTGTVTAPTFSGNATSWIGYTSVPTWNQNTTGNAASVSDGMYLSAAQSSTGKKIFIGDMNKNTGDGSGTLEVRSSGNVPVGITFHRPGVFASKLTFDTDNIFHFGGWSDGTDTGTVKAATFIGALSGNFNNGTGAYSAGSNLYATYFYGTYLVGNQSGGSVTATTGNFSGGLYDAGNRVITTANISAQTVNYASAANYAQYATNNTLYFPGGGSIGWVSNYISFGVGSGWISASADGNVGGSSGFNNWSDQRLKKNIVTIDSPLSIIKQLRGVRFNWNGIGDIKDTTSLQSGFIAQEVEKVLPSSVGEMKGYKSFAPTDIIPFLVEGMKEQQTQIESLTKKTDSQQKQIDDLKKSIEELKK